MSMIEEKSNLVLDDVNLMKMQLKGFFFFLMCALNDHYLQVASFLILVSLYTISKFYSLPMYFAALERLPKRSGFPQKGSRALLLHG